ncbi:unnamed protein product [Leptidea sinapis]|uniref:Uncharacterized protein n=1 Tax=Leptidea sinapis TaxID=189913 RepID=A0A5E4QHC5_9NEOP|nr:unnamed protein product [Leptidea sinapis]
MTLKKMSNANLFQRSENFVNSLRDLNVVPIKVFETLTEKQNKELELIREQRQADAEQEKAAAEKAAAVQEAKEAEEKEN